MKFQTQDRFASVTRILPVQTTQPHHQITLATVFTLGTIFAGSFTETQGQGNVSSGNLCKFPRNVETREGAKDFA